MVRLKDIAAEANVSVMTVSNVVNGNLSKVSKEKADEIKSDVLAEEITVTPDGYIKDFDLNGESVTLGVKKV